MGRISNRVEIATRGIRVMKNNYYYLMHVNFAELILNMNPKAAEYEGKTLILTGQYPVAMSAIIVIADQQQE